MGSIPPELSLDWRASFVPKTIGDFLKDVSAIVNVADKASKLDDFVKRLEEEMKKIDAFKRELPLCMLLLNDAIVTVKEELAQCEPTKNSQPVLEEFIPLKKKDCDEDKEGLNCNDKKEKDCRDKKNWMSSVQLWNTDDDSIDLKQNFNSQSKINEKRAGLETKDPFQDPRNSTVVGRAFVPFKPYSGFSAAAAAKNERKNEFPVHGLSLLTPGTDKTMKDEPVCGGINRLSNSGRAVSASASSSHPNAQSNLRAGSAVQQQAARKQRRCWSPELHRRFVSALQQLGGSQVATPKQIRELMQVDGLTNDEVKSHLQKYRLHTRRLSPGSAASAAPSAAGQLVGVLGGLWTSQDQCGGGESSKPSSSQSGSPQGPFQLGTNGGGISSPTTGDESMEDDEDAKSEGYSWKSHHSQSQTRER